MRKMSMAPNPNEGDMRKLAFGFCERAFCRPSDQRRRASTCIKRAAVPSARTDRLDVQQRALHRAHTTGTAQRITEGFQSSWCVNLWVGSPIRCKHIESHRRLVLNRPPLTIHRRRVANPQRPPTSQRPDTKSYSVSPLVLTTAYVT